MEFRKQLAWSVECFGQWNGISFFLFQPLSPCPTFRPVLMQLVLLVMVLLWTTNSSMVAGLLSNFHCPLLTKNFFPPVLATHVWGLGWSNRRILFNINNKAVVHILNSRTSPDPNIMDLLRSLVKAAACFSFTFAAVHVPGRNNGIADALSRFNFQAFHSQAPQAKKFPILIPPQLLAKLSMVI